MNTAWESWRLLRCRAFPQFWTIKFYFIFFTQGYVPSWVLVQHGAVPYRTNLSPGPHSSTQAAPPHLSHLSLEPFTVCDRTLVSSHLCPYTTCTFAPVQPRLFHFLCLQGPCFLVTPVNRCSSSRQAQSLLLGCISGESANCVLWPHDLWPFALFTNFLSHSHLCCLFLLRVIVCYEFPMGTNQTLFSSQQESHAGIHRLISA